MPGGARTHDRELVLPRRFPITGRIWLVCLLIAAVATVIGVRSAGAAVDVPPPCPPVADKPGAIPHVDYTGVQHLTYCVKATVAPGANIIRLNGTGLFPNEPGYITRFDPDLVYADGTVPGVDVVHLHHAVWIVNFNPQFAAGEEKTITQLPQGFGWRNKADDNWLLNDMLHDLVAKSHEVYIVWRIDFVPDTSPAAASIKPVTTRWMDVAGVSLYPVFDALRKFDPGGQYTFPDEATGEARQDIGSAQTWTAPGPRTLIGTAGHLHPGGINTQLKATRGGQTNTLFTSNAHYFEPAGAVSWDVSMGATPGAFWRVKLQTGDKLSVHTTYDTKRADWYEGMGIMPIAVYNGTDVGGLDAMDPNITQVEVLTHGHLHENDNHGGASTNLANPLSLAGFVDPNDKVNIRTFSYDSDPGGAFTRRPPTVLPGQSLQFKNFDAAKSVNAFHTITSCKAPCNGSTGIAYPVADGKASFDSGQLGFNGNGGATSFVNAPAADRDTWNLPNNLDPGTYTYFCRIHPFMRGSFRVASTRVKFRKLIRHPKSGTATLVVEMPYPGALTLGGRRIRTQERTHKAKASADTRVKAERRLRLQIKPKAKAKRMLERRGKLRVKAVVTFTPDGGKKTHRAKKFKLVKH
jgi:plastocyanin